MTRSRRPRHSIHRVDDPTPESRDFRRGDGHTLRVLVWSPLRWERLTEGDRPTGAIRLACGGWIASSPLDEARPLASRDGLLASPERGATNEGEGPLASSVARLPVASGIIP